MFLIKDIEIIEAIKYVFDLHSFMRHPTSEKKEYGFFFDYKWSKDQTDKLVFAAESCMNLLSCLTSAEWTGKIV